MKYSFEHNTIKVGRHTLALDPLKRYLIDRYPTLVWRHRVAFKNKMTIDWDGILSVANEFGILKTYINEQ